MELNVIVLITDLIADLITVEKTEHLKLLKTNFPAGLLLVLARLCASLSLPRILVNVHRHQICFRELLLR